MHNETDPPDGKKKELPVILFTSDKTRTIPGMVFVNIPKIGDDLLTRYKRIILGPANDEDVMKAFASLDLENPEIAAEAIDTMEKNRPLLYQGIRSALSGDEH